MCLYFCVVPLCGDILSYWVPVLCLVILVNFLFYWLSVAVCVLLSTRNEIVSLSLKLRWNVQFCFSWWVIFFHTGYMHFLLRHLRCRWCVWDFYAVVFWNDTLFYTLAVEINISSAIFFLFFGPCIFNNENKKINQQNVQINSGLIYYWSITPTCFGPSAEAIIREFEILESYKAIVLIC